MKSNEEWNQQIEKLTKSDNHAKVGMSIIYFLFLLGILAVIYFIVYDTMKILTFVEMVFSCVSVTVVFLIFIIGMLRSHKGL